MLARTARALRRPGAAAAGEYDLPLRHHGTSQGSAAQRADTGADPRVGTLARADLWCEAGCAGAFTGAAVPLRAEFVRPAFRPSRRRAGTDAAVRPGAIPAAD